MRVYEGIYDIVDRNLKNADQTFEYRKTTFLYGVMEHPQTVDVSKYLSLQNPDFFQAVCVAVYQRLPEEKAAEAWKGKYGMPREEFQKEVLREIANSSFAAINHIQFVNNPYFKQHKGIKYRLLGLLYGLTDKSSLREFGKKLPAPLQSIIRKVFL